MMLSVEKVMENLPDFSDAEIAAIFGLSVERITQIRKDGTARKRKAAADSNEPQAFFRCAAPETLQNLPFPKWQGDTANFFCKKLDNNAQSLYICAVRITAASIQAAPLIFFPHGHRDL